MLWDFGKGLFFMALLALVSVGLGHTSVGRRVEQFGYDRIQKLLSSERIPVAVVDVSALQPVPFTIDGETGTATPRATLKDLIQAITAQQPRAIGVDIDFSPDPSGYVWPRDPEFFQFCLANDVPVFLGVNRNLNLTPDKWLGSEDYQNLAAGMIVPKNNTRKMPKWIQISRDSPPGPSLGTAVAGGFQVTQSGLSRWLHEHGLVEQVSEKEIGEGMTVGEFPVDYSALPSLIEDKTVSTINPQVIRDQGRMLRDKIVLIGRGLVTDEDDRFKVEGFEGEIAGVYIHASAAYTLRNAPLYELTSTGRVGIDLLLSFTVLLGVTLIRLYFMNRTNRNVAAHRVEIMLTALVGIAAFIGGVMFVGQTRLVWSDFVLVLGVLFLHIPLERWLGKGQTGAKQKSGSLIHDLILEKESSGSK